jgi:hypothetical protein
MRLLLSLLLLTLIGCSDATDSEVSGGKFTVHFNNTKDHELAKKIVEFWKEDSLLTGEPQDVRLERTQNGYDLYLISERVEKKDDLTFEEIKSLTTLKQHLQEKVFKEKQLSLVIADENFKPLFRPNLY